MLRTTLGVSALAALRYYRSTAQIPKLFYQANDFNQKIIQQLPKLQQKYQPTPWLKNPHLHIAYYSISQYMQRHPHFDLIESCLMPDGTSTDLAWLGDDLEATKPTLVVLHTVTATAQSMYPLLRDLRRLTQWRIVLCFRRGHSFTAQPFSQINIMGSVPDFKVQLAHIQKKFPHSPLYAVASSAGTATLARYLGEQGHDTALQAAFLYCPGYDLRIAFDRIHPLYDRYLAKAIKQKFLLPYRQQLSKYNSLNTVLHTKTLSNMQHMLYEFSGFTSQQAYLNACNPAEVLHNISIPCMILNAEDDPICHIKNVTPFIRKIRHNPYTILVTTRHGSHCGHFEGWTAHAWAHRLMADYLLNTYQQQHGAA